jgi:hypothetical protein
MGRRHQTCTNQPCYKQVSSITIDLFSVLHVQQLRILLAFDFLKSKNIFQITGSGEHGCRGHIFSITAAVGGGGGSLFCLTKKAWPKLSFQSWLQFLFPKLLARGHSIFLQLVCFNPRHSNIFKIFPTKWYGYTRRHRDWRCVKPPHTHSL